MMNIEETTKKVDLLLQDRGLTSEYQEQAVRQLLYHLFVAIEIYRYMTFAEKAKAGYWYRIFKGCFSLRNFLKERKRTRERKNPPCTPLIKKGGVEKGQKTSLSPEQNFDGLDEGQMAFWKECSKYIGPKYSEDLVKAFFYYYAQRMRKNGKMAWENEDKWTLHLRLAGWKKRSFAKNDEAAEIRLAKAKAGKQQTAKVTEQQVAAARQRMIADEKREQETAEAKANSVSLEDYLKKNPDSNLRMFKK